MKQQFIQNLQRVVFLFLLSSSVASAQTEDYYASPQLYGKFTFIGDLFYFTYDHSLLVTDANNPNSPATTLFSTLEFPQGLAVYNNEMYIPGYLSGSIQKFSLNDAVPTLTNVANLTSVGNYPAHMLVVGHDLYVSQFFGDKICRLNLDSALPITPESIITTNIDGPNGLLEVGDYIYVCISQSNKIIRFKPTNPAGTVENVITTGLNWPHSLVKVGNDILVSCMDGNKIVRFNYTDTNPQVTTVLTLDKPTFIELRNGWLYTFLRDAKKIVGIATANLSTDSLTLTPQVLLYPNPAQEAISITNCAEGLSAAIFTAEGKLVTSFTTAENLSIPVTNLANGAYFIKIDGKPTLRFLKN
ncbi:T9SS type A sorting domain-containing protein [Flavobacterium sp.]|uniref:T9SS type A sorting domain-containing protein n=1 Tax=Flavobacterium sp. TaxID=239 RepID=UPI002FD9C89C